MSHDIAALEHKLRELQHSLNLKGSRTRITPTG